MLTQMDIGQFKILFEEGSNQDLTRLELLACDMPIWNNKITVNADLPDFYNKGELNRIVQNSENTIKTAHVNEQDSDYSDGYNSEESDKPYDLKECEAYDPASDIMKDNRPQNYSHYLRMKGVERNVNTKNALSIIARKHSFVRCQKYHGCFVKMACDQNFNFIPDTFGGYTCPW